MTDIRKCIFKSVHTYMCGKVYMVKIEITAYSVIFFGTYRTLN